MDGKERRPFFFFRTYGKNFSSSPASVGHSAFGGDLVKVKVRTKGGSVSVLLKFKGSVF